MRLGNNQLKATAPYIVLTQETHTRLQQFFNRNPKIKKTAWYAEAIEEKLEREKEGVYGHDQH